MHVASGCETFIDELERLDVRPLSPGELASGIEITDGEILARIAVDAERCLVVVWLATCGFCRSRRRPVQKARLVLAISGPPRGHAITVRAQRMPEVLRAFERGLAEIDRRGLRDRRDRNDAPSLRADEQILPAGEIEEHRKHRRTSHAERSSDALEVDEQLSSALGGAGEDGGEQTTASAPDRHGSDHRTRSGHALCDTHALRFVLARALEQHESRALDDADDRAVVVDAIVRELQPSSSAREDG